MPLSIAQSRAVPLRSITQILAAIDQGDAANVILTIIFVLLFGSLGLVLFYR